VRVEGTPVEAADVQSLAFFDCDLTGLSLPGRRVELRLIDCTGKALDLANTTFTSLEISSTTLSESRLVGAQLTGALRDVTLHECQLDLASLRMAKLSRIEFHACSLVETDAYAAESDSVLFSHCDLTGADVTAATFARSEMSGCDLQNLRGVEALRGVQIPLSDLLPITPLLADALGIVPTNGPGGCAQQEGSDPSLFG
jgi:uncharacterized protein YjbI with pentapeptide repeats